MEQQTLIAVKMVEKENIVVQMDKTFLDVHQQPQQLKLHQNQQHHVQLHVQQQQQDQ